MTSTKYIGMDVHKESISTQVMNSVGKVVMECVMETKATTILQFIDGLRGRIKGYQEILLLKERLNPPRLPQKEVRTVEVA